MKHELSNRGFKHMEPIHGDYPAPWGLSIYESSAAMEAAIWLRLGGASGAAQASCEAVAHLSLEQAEYLSKQLAWLSANHYQVVDPRTLYIWTIDPETDKLVKRVWQ